MLKNTNSFKLLREIQSISVVTSTIDFIDTNGVQSNDEKILKIIFIATFLYSFHFLY